ncbi:MAG TPA: hypothetical protein VHT91_13010 [Kofleriaceae bacterium]|jgi:hypothetical protein|nr:hypothetical protein [Kofleriaceae bacterium]
MRDSRIRRSIVSLLVTAGLALVLVGIVLTCATQAVFDRRSFADRAARSLRDPAVAGLLADRISLAAIRVNRDLTAYRPLIVSGARQVVSSAAFSPVLRASAEALHDVVFSQDGNDLLLDLADGGVLLRSIVASLPPRLSATIPDDVVVDLSERIASSRQLSETLPKLREAAALATYAWWVLGGGVGCLLLAAALSPTRWRIGRETGWLLVLAALVLVLVRVAGVALIPRWIDDPAVSAAAVGVWRSFTAGAVDRAWLVGGIGIVLLCPAFRLETPARAVWRWLRTVPGRGVERVLRAAVLIAGGYGLVRWPRAAIELAVSALGILLLYLGASALGRGMFQRGRDEPIARRALRPAVIALSVGLAVAVGLWSGGGAGSGPAEGLARDACNGRRELCGRPLDTVVFATAHNAMGSSDQPAWWFPAQEAGIPAQLRDGVRGFQIDAHYGYQVADRVLTVVADEGEARRSYEAVLGKEGVDAAFRIRARLLGKPEGERRLYLCHGFCELGALDLVTVFRSMRDFLRANPREVVILVVQDEDVRPEDIAGAMEQSGLSERVYRGPVTGPWPTLGEMIERHQQVLIVAENRAGGAPWFHPAFEVFQETPYDVRTVTGFSCQPWRGETRGTLFQLNHWITRVPAPRPSDAAIVNAYDFLMARARRCMRERHKLPNLLAVDFYRTGDLFAVVDELNRERTVAVAR